LIDSIIFDLDGTLWNASEASAHGWTRALQDLGYTRVIQSAEIAAVSGLPFQECLRRVCPGVDESDFSRLFEIVSQREYESVKRLGGNLYPGVHQGIASLSENHRLFIVSNCQEWYLTAFMEHCPVSDRFEDWECFGRSGRPKGENIRKIVENHNLRSPVYVGDTESDGAAAFQAGVQFIHVTYGFGSARSTKDCASFDDLVLHLQTGTQED